MLDKIEQLIQVTDFYLKKKNKIARGYKHILKTVT